MTFLGHICDVNGVRADPKKVEAIRNLERPTDANGIRRLLLGKGILRKKHTSSGTNPPGVSLNRLELKKQMRYFFRAKIFCVLQKNVLGNF